MSAARLGESEPSDFVQLAVFVVGDSSYALDIMRVREVLRHVPIVAVREAPAFVEGVITLRGAYIPVVSMRRRLGLDDVAIASRRILIAMARGGSFGLLIDSMTEVIRVPRTSLQRSPMPDAATKTALVAGLCEVRGRALQLLNLNALLVSVPCDAALAPVSPC